MRKRPQMPIALTIAGSDSGGGAGIQADLKTFASLGVHGTSAITCLTAQNPTGVAGIWPCSPEIVRKQIHAVFTELPPTAVKTGMLYSAEIIREVVKFFTEAKRPPLIVDPVMVATSGARLLKPAAIELMKQELLPRAALVTPNLAEAEVLVGARLRSVEDLRHAAREIQARFNCAALVKGGHLPGLKQACDIFYDGRQELLLSAPFIKGIRPHGTGCTYSAAITGYLAKGLSLPKSAASAKEHVSNAIAQGNMVGPHFVLGIVQKKIA
jgi:hydroxymethylpyrimidine/phosphomethylpyrimidine kinase